MSRSTLKTNSENKKDLLGTTTILVCENCNFTKKSVVNRSKSQCEKCQQRMAYQCLKCDNLRTVSVAGAYRHVKFKCGQPEFYHCEHCDYRDKSKCRMRRHILVKHIDKPEEKGLVECKCGCEYKGKKNVWKRRSACDLAPFLACNFCDHKAIVRGNLKKDLERMHKDFEAGVIQNSVATMADKECDVSQPTETEIATIPKRFNCKDFSKLYCSMCDVNFEINTMKERECLICGTMTHLQCLKCDRRYVCSASMNAHLRNKCGPKKYFQCADCDYRVVSKSRLADHIERMHATVALKDYHKCGKCGKGFKHRSNQRIHEKLCGKEADLQCEFCPFKGKSRPYFNRHVQNHILQQNNGVSMVNSSAVGETFGGGVKVIENTSTSDKENVSCTSVPMSEKEKSRVQELMRAFCSKCKVKARAVQGRNKCIRCSAKLSYYCVECNKTYPVQCHLRNHIASKHVIDELKKRHQCPNCGKSFVFYKGLWHHLMNCGKEPNLPCDHCSFKSKTKRYLDLHIQRRHPELTKTRKIYVCQCGKVYMNSSGLSRHRKFYCGKEPTFACEHCSFKSYMKGELIVHRQRVHLLLFTDEVLKCKVCGKECSNMYTHGTHVKNCGLK